MAKGYRQKFFESNPGFNGMYQCVKCKGWYPKSEIDVDHRISKKMGGTDDLWNLQAMCKHCNRSKQENSSSGEMLQTVAGAVISGIANQGLQGGVVNLTRLGKSVATQKIKNSLGIKYKR